MWQQVAWLAGVGAVGTVARWAMHVWVQRLTGSAFPWGTLAVNALGCLLFGIVFAAAEERNLIGSQTRMIILVGFMGAFTTFSTFAFDTAALLRDSQWLYAAGNVALQNVLGLACVFAGLALGRLL